MNTDRFKYRAYFTSEYPVPEMRGKLVYSEQGLDYAACVEGVEHGNVVIMFCTAEKDAHGKLLYEHDIIQDKEVVTHGVPSIGILMIPEEGSRIHWVLDGRGCHVSYDMRRVVVAGNIYENLDFPCLAPCHHKYIADNS